MGLTLRHLGVLGTNNVHIAVENLLLIRCMVHDLHRLTRADALLEQSSLMVDALAQLLARACHLV